MHSKMTYKKAPLLCVALLFIAVLVNTSAAAYPGAQTQHGSAVLTGEADSLVAFKAEASDDSFTVAQYWQGLEVQCKTSPEAPWVLVSFLNHEGYVKRENLMPGQNSKETTPLFPEMVVANGSGAWLNLREEPSRGAKVLGKYLDGHVVIFYGIIHTPIQDGNEESTWAHVRTADGQTGYMVPAYLWNHSPFTLHVASERAYGATPHLDRGVQARAMVTENFAMQTFIAEVYLTFDRPYTTNDDIVGFNLYINDLKVAQLKPVSDPEKPEAAPDNFWAGFAYNDAIDKVHMVAVLQEAGENPEETLLLYERPEQKGTMP